MGPGRGGDRLVTTKKMGKEAAEECWKSQSSVSTTLIADTEFNISQSQWGWCSTDDRGILIIPSVAYLAAKRLAAGQEKVLLRLGHLVKSPKMMETFSCDLAIINMEENPGTRLENVCQSLSSISVARSHDKKCPRFLRFCFRVMTLTMTFSCRHLEKQHSENSGDMVLVVSNLFLNHKKKHKIMPTHQSSF